MDLNIFRGRRPALRVLFLCAAALVLFTGQANAAVIASVLADNLLDNTGLLLGAGPSTLAIEFTTPVEYRGVTISGHYRDFMHPSTLTAWLTTRIGPDFTVTDQLATTTLDPGPAFDALTPVFSGLTLPAGTYYFVVTGTRWLDARGSSSNPFHVVTAPGVSFQELTASGSGPTGVDFGTSALNWNFEITEGTPEPAGFALVTLGLAGIMAWSRKR